MADALQQLGFDARANAGDPLKLVIRDACGGTALAQQLRERGIEVEFADRAAVVLMLTPDNTEEDLIRIWEALADIGAAGPAWEDLPALSVPIRAMTIREAVFASAELIDTQKAEGRICAVPTVSCPPAVPILVCGERITPDAIACFQYYGVEYCTVVKE